MQLFLDTAEKLELREQICWVSRYYIQAHVYWHIFLLISTDEVFIGYLLKMILYAITNF